MSLKRWKDRVRKAAEGKWPSAEAPSTGDVTFKVTYYYDSKAPDVDNIIKPIQDALNGLIYVDDTQVVTTSSHKRDINGGFRIRGMSSILAEGFINGDEFLHIEVDLAGDLTEIV